MDSRCPETIQHELRGIAEQCGKRQYFNAIGRTARLLQLLNQGAVDAVNGREPNPTLDYRERTVKQGSPEHLSACAELGITPVCGKVPGALREKGWYCTRGAGHEGACAAKHSALVCYDCGLPQITEPSVALRPGEIVFCNDCFQWANLRAKHGPCLKSGKNNCRYHSGHPWPCALWVYKDV